MIRQQTLSADDRIHGLYYGALPGAWRYRLDRIWHNTATDELVTIRQGTMAQSEDDGYQVCIHRTGSVETVLDNIPLARANEMVARYIWRGAYPEESWLFDVQDGDGG